MISDRIQKLLPIIEKHFYHEDFDDPTKAKEITGDMPDLAAFEKKKKGLAADRKRAAISKRIFYVAPTLSKEQTAFLFKKLNYYKYHANKIKDGINLERLEFYINEYLNVKNDLASSNYRLIAPMLTKYYKPGSRSEDFVDEALSIGTSCILSTIDYFDFNRGFQFSTYTTWALIKNLQKGYADFIKRRKKFQQLNLNLEADDVYYSESILAKEDDCLDNMNHEYKRDLVTRLLALNDEKETKYKGVLSDYYGIVNEPMTFIALGEKHGVSKERIRQVSQRGLSNIKKYLEENKLPTEI